MGKVKVTDKRGIENQQNKAEAAPKAEPVEIPKAPDYSKINIQIKGDRILIQQFPETKDYGCIHLPNGLGADIDKGRVCGIGEDVKHLKVGDVIFKIKDLGQILEDDDENVYLFLPENAAIAVDRSFKNGK